MNNNSATEAVEYTDAEVEQATSLFLEHHLIPTAQRIGRPVGEVLDELAEDLFTAGVLAYMLAARNAAKSPGVNVRAEAGVLFIGMLRKMPQREDLGTALLSEVYHQARAAQQG
ncbi:hypothetical protein OG594_46720 [Streptomyces sp. NBC_01214]|uniref:hypothetical protein n=1 Tax=Streptomyces sp. NBC_01214 TaxID=2903777 RepID=UPI0022577007|nr:hypothetical protein [Streptomyces sp. NBC_01214]MCX4808950.1 hypothetical protein [Streptomyces sp. NBC_01214]